MFLVLYVWFQAPATVSIHSFQRVGEIHLLGKLENNTTPRPEILTLDRCRELPLASVEVLALVEQGRA